MKSKEILERVGITMEDGEPIPLMYKYIAKAVYQMVSANYKLARLEDKIEKKVQKGKKSKWIARFSESVGKIVELKYKNSMDNIIERKGRLEKDLDWYYLYDEGKSGNQFNLAIQEKDLHKVVSLNVL